MIEVRDISKTFSAKSGVLSLSRKPRQKIQAVSSVNLRVNVGSILGLVGESGSGKTTLGRLILRLIEPTSGEIWLEGSRIFPSKSKLSRVTRKKMQMIFQDPYTSLNPMQKIRSVLEEPLIIHGENGARKQRITEALQSVGLVPPSDYLDKYPHELSGGQRQRVAFARALMLRPSFIVADEPVSNLDILIRKPILDKFLELRDKFHFSSLFITHDIAIARYLSDEISVMYRGKVVESGPPVEVVASPLHPYTQVLIECVPKKHERTEVHSARSSPPAVEATTGGCIFASRCGFRQSICSNEMPSLREVRPGHAASCHFAEQFI